MSDQYKNVATIAVVVAVAAVAAVAALLILPGEEPTGSFHVVDFYLDDPAKPTRIIVDPRTLEKVVVNDVIVFNNKTGKEVTVKFSSATGSPFKNNEFKIPAGTGSPHAEPETITVNPKVVTNFEYRVTAGELSSDHGPEQSPVIRVGPKPSTVKD